MLNDPLFVRQGASMTPTPLPEKSFRKVRQALALFESSLQVR